MNKGKAINGCAGCRGAETCFDAFWSAYPRRVGKGAARKAFAKAVGKTTSESILDALARQRDAGMFNVEICYIPHPQTWLNQERWEDEVVKVTVEKFRTTNHMKGESGNYAF